MYNALLIGAGNIGALYDFENDEVQTHAKAYQQHPGFQWSIFDQDTELARKVANRYNVPVLSGLNPQTLKQFDCVSICTPTATHTRFLKMAFETEVPVVICEKPITTNLGELGDLAEAYESSKSKVIVNYMRRFQPSFVSLRDQIQEIRETEKLLHVGIRYQRGFINNCSHALDLFFFLTGEPLAFSDVVITSRDHDHFPNDPTVSMNLRSGDVAINIHGLSKVRYSLFEIELYFECQKISILDAGNSIAFMQASQEGPNYSPLQVNKNHSRIQCLKNYMTPVVQEAHELLTKKKIADNFLNSLELNMLLLKTIQN